MQGGAIFLNDAVLLNMTANFFESNRAVEVSSSTYAKSLPSRGKGGALYLGCIVDTVAAQSNSGVTTDQC